VAFTTEVEAAARNLVAEIFWRASELFRLRAGCTVVRGKFVSRRLV